MRATAGGSSQSGVVEVVRQIEASVEQGKERAEGIPVGVVGGHGDHQMPLPVAGEPLDVLTALAGDAGMGHVDDHQLGAGAYQLVAPPGDGARSIQGRERPSSTTEPLGPGRWSPGTRGAGGRAPHQRARKES